MSVAISPVMGLPQGFAAKGPAHFQLDVVEALPTVVLRRLSEQISTISPPDPSSGSASDNPSPTG